MTTFAGHSDAAALASQGSTRRPWLFLMILTVAATTDAINSTILVVARGHVMGGTHATPDEVAWLNMAYLAAKLTAFPAAVWLDQRIASGRLIVGSTAMLMISSVGCAATSDLTALIAWRIIQGTAGAALLVSSQLVLFDVFPRCRQGIVQAVFAFSTIMAPTTIAPALQGWIVDNASWSWIFVVNLPLGLCGLLVCRIMPIEDTTLSSSPPRRFDWIGVTLLAIAMTSIVFVTQEGSRYNWFDEPEIAEVSLLAGLAMIAFLAWQVVRQSRGALIDFAVFRDQHFSFGFIVSFVAGCALSGSAFVVPAFATSVLDLSPTYAGLLLLPSGLMVCAGLLVAGALIQLKDLDPTKTIPFGIICFMTAMWMLAGSNSESGLPDMVPALLLRGLGLGLLFVSLTLVTLGGLDRRVLPQGIALFNIGRQIGGQIGIAWLTTYLDHQNALNRTVLSQYLAVGNRALAERQEALGSLLAARGHEPEGATQAATAFIQKAFAQQVATLSFNECFLAIGLLFVVATPILLIIRFALNRK
ncbi:DHA2 family efflux MFS transporter permease subunit [Bradyrhizobium sp. LHD-71]|uniref:DHA2 family efflux MFS transporter permease subunit n=1 Tax=Bradyrhizobium sp. LHD-71 TaxID=3072141 RepID=UPI00280F9AA6|nr:DHA2 family efflux MFS transporter permease subunit [Bradyrhizobium sp. LHD-71]MDQ8730628.1 DHA2 family efflux MFS transporter permease subunit [Bradyrhizobium sp. LHD-71]